MNGAVMAAIRNGVSIAACDSPVCIDSVPSLSASPAAPNGERHIMLLRWALPVILALAAGGAIAADEDAPNRRPVKVVADKTIAGGNKGMLPLYVSGDWSKPEPDITRAVIVLHGRLRNADVYYDSARTAQVAAGMAGQATLMIVPQFLADIDVEAHHLPPDTLLWTLEGWVGGVV